jgi:hypothetical protein
MAAGHCGLKGGAKGRLMGLIPGRSSRGQQWGCGAGRGTGRRGAEGMGQCRGILGARRLGAGHGAARAPGRPRGGASIKDMGLGRRAIGGWRGQRHQGLMGRARIPGMCGGVKKRAAAAGRARRAPGSRGGAVHAGRLAGRLGIGARGLLIVIIGLGSRGGDHDGAARDDRGDVGRDIGPARRERGAGRGAAERSAGIARAPAAAATPAAGLARAAGGEGQGQRAGRG